MKKHIIREGIEKRMEKCVGEDCTIKERLGTADQKKGLRVHCSREMKNREGEPAEQREEIAQKQGWRRLY